MYKIFGIICVLLLSFSAFWSCKPKQTCPAYHSHFLLFPEVQDKHFSLFQDSIPKENSAVSRKLWTGIAVGPHSKRTYKKRHYVIPMKDVYPETEGEDSTGGSSIINLDSTKNKNVFTN